MPIRPIPRRRQRTLVQRRLGRPFRVDARDLLDARADVRVGLAGARGQLGASPTLADADDREAGEGEEDADGGDGDSDFGAEGEGALVGLGGRWGGRSGSRDVDVVGVE